MKLRLAVCLLQLASVVGAAEPALVKLALTEGKDTRFAHLTTKDGLSPGQVRDIVQDDQGFLWFNTSGGLNRYDGYQFKSYRRDPAHLNYPATRYVQFIFKDRSNYLWVSSEESLDRFNPATEISTRFPVDHNRPQGLLAPALHVSQDRAGILWLATDAGLHRLDPASGEIRHYSHDPADPATLSSSLVRSTYEDREGTFWVCTVEGLEAFDRRTGKVTERIRLNAPGSRSVKAFEDHAGVLWVIYSSGNGLASWDRQTRRLTHYSFKDREPPATSLSGADKIYEDADGNLWLATYGSGLVRIDSSRRSAVRYRHSALDADSLSDDIVDAVFEDREGSIWVGVMNGVDHFQRKPLPFKRYRHEADNPQSPLRTAVSAVYADSHENVWIGSVFGMTRIDGKTGHYSFFRQAGPAPANLSNIFVISVVEDRSGYLWFGTFGGGLNRYDPRTGRFAAFRHNPADPHSLSHDIVYSLMVDHQGTLWAGTADGLNRCEDPQSGRFRSWKVAAAGASLQEVPAMVEDSNGLLWLICNRTLQRFDPVGGRFTAYKFGLSEAGRSERESSPSLASSGRRPLNSFLTIDHFGVLWVATPDGLLRFNRDREEFKLYQERDGLPASSVLGIVEDHKGNLWVGTEGGLSQFNPTTKTFTNYFEADGLAGNAFEGFPAACQSPRGQMFFGSKSGLTSFWPDQIVEKPLVVPVVLTGFSLLNRQVAPGSGSLLAKAITFTQSLTLSHDQNHTFSFEFSALSYLDPERNQYRYMLEGLDPSWNLVDSAHRVATFTTLAARTYTLRIQGSNNRGIWNEQGVALQLKILPPWWGTWSFRALYAAALLILATAAYRYRVRRLQHEFEKLRDVIDTIPGMAWTALPDGSNAFVNRRWAEYTGLPPEDTAGWTAALHPDDRESYSARWKAALTSGEPFEAEARFRCAATGEYRSLLARGVPLRGERGNIVRWYGILTDIEDRKRAEQDRERLQTDLAHINRISTMGELSASIAHEVNQPLSGVVSNGSACLRWLAGETPNLEEAREAARRIVRDGKRAGEVVGRIRALTKRAATPRERLDPNEIIREVLALVGDDAKRKRVIIRTQFAENLSPVSGDRVQLQQVVLNLIMNAMDAMNSVEERSRDLVITTENDQAEQVVVAVKDFGTGVEEKAMGKIFDPFYTTKPGGMGMGLSISSSIVKSHGGRLWAAGNDGPGTTFYFTLPQYREEESHAGTSS
jgi:PAS domain S-box-containing protein